MTKKILCLFDMEWIHFGIAKYVKEIFDCELYGIVDIDFNMRTFFENQDIVKLEKQWFYRDYVRKDKVFFDVDFLKKIEEKYHLNLWNIVFSERFFIKFNPYYKFSYNEIMAILYNECKIFDSILDEVNPDYLLIKFTDSHQSHLLHQMCKSKQVKILMQCPSRFGGRYSIYEEYERIIDFGQPKSSSLNVRSESELKKYIEDYNTLNMLKSTHKTKSIIKKTEKYFHYLNILRDANVTQYYAHYGKTKWKAITQLLFIKRWNRKRFIDKNLKKDVDLSEPFIYYPLHVDPERQTLLAAPFYSNQIEVVNHIAKSLPVGFKLYVKEHGMMFLSNWRPKSYYEQLMNLPNVELIHPDVDSKKLLESCSLVITINGTTGLEAVFYKKPAIVFANVNYLKMSSVQQIERIEDLPDKIKIGLKSTIDLSELNEYIDLVERNSFEIDMASLYRDFNDYFSEEFNTAKSSISISKMNIFIEKNSESFKKLANEHVKLMKNYQSRT